MAFGTTPRDSSTIPIGSVYPPNNANGNFVALQGGTITTDTEGNQSAPVMIEKGDGADGTQGAKADSAATDSTSAWSVVALLKGILSKLLGSIAVTGTFWQTTQPVSGTVGVSNFPATQASNLTEINGTAIGNANALPTTVQNWQAQTPTNLDQVNGVSLSNANPVPTQDIAQSGYIALSSPPTATTAATDTAFTFSSQINHVTLQNNTTANLNFAFDVASSAGSLLLAPGQTYIAAKKVTAVHLLTTTAENVNGSVAANIVLLGEL